MEDIFSYHTRLFTDKIVCVCDTFVIDFFVCFLLTVISPSGL